MRFLTLLLFVSLSFISSTTHAQVYGDLSYANIIKTMLRFGAVSLTNDGVIDDYAKMNACDDYQKYYNNDFKLQDLRVNLRKQIPDLTAGFPDAYYFKSKMYLDRYDFAGKIFKLSSKSQLLNTNSFFLAATRDGDVCIRGQRITYMPGEVGAVLDQPVTLEGLPIAEERASALIDTMNKERNVERAIYARFSLLVTFAPPFDGSRNNRYNMDAQLLNIEFFEDADFTKPIWIFTRG